MEKNVFVIGISGATNAGKTSLSNYLQGTFQNVIVHPQDDYIKLDDPQKCSKCDKRVMETKLCTQWNEELPLPHSQGTNEFPPPHSQGTNALPPPHSRGTNELPPPHYHDWECPSRHDLDTYWSDLCDIIDRESRAGSGDFKSKTILIVEGFLIYSDPRVSALCNLKLFLEIDSVTCHSRRANRGYVPTDPPGYFECCVWPGYLTYRKKLLQNKMDLIHIDGKSCFEVINQEVLKLI